MGTPRCNKGGDDFNIHETIDARNKQKPRRNEHIQSVNNFERNHGQGITQAEFSRFRIVLKFFSIRCKFSNKSIRDFHFVTST